MLTKQQLEEIKSRAEKATKGPWCFAVLGDCAQLSPVERPKRVIGDLSIHDGRGNQYKNHISGEEGFSNSTFIAYARTDVPALLAEVERLKNLAKDAYSEGFHDACQGHQEDDAWIHSWTRDILLSQEAPR